MIEGIRRIGEFVACELDRRVPAWAPGPQTRSRELADAIWAPTVRSLTDARSPGLL